MTCSIDTSERAGSVNALLAAGRTPHYIEGQMRALGQPTKAETIKRHLEKCLAGNPRAGTALDGKGGMSTDFATAVRNEASRLLASEDRGGLKIRTEHGLAAQALLDRRAEKQADRVLMVELARLLSGSRITSEPDPDLIVEGEWREVEPQEDADGALAPLALVAGDSARD